MCGNYLKMVAPVKAVIFDMDGTILGLYILAYLIWLQWKFSMHRFLGFYKFKVGISTTTDDDTT